MSKKRKEKVEEIKEETIENNQLESRKTYHKKYLKSKEFKAVKEYVLSRDGYKCQVCGRTAEEATLVCHHRCYKHLGEANLAECEDCVTLCQQDHLVIHAKNCNKYWYSLNNPRNRNDLREIEIDGVFILVGNTGDEFYNAKTYKKYKIYSNKKRKNRKTIQTEEKSFYCNRLVAKAFPEICGEWFDGCEVHHVNENPEDDRAENLRVINKIEHQEIHKNFMGEWAKDNLSITTYQYNLDGSYVSSYSNSIEASEKTGISSSAIRNCLVGISNSAGGFIWKQTYSDTIEPLKEKKKCKTPIIQYSLSGELIREWEGVKDASTYFGKPKSSAIGNCLIGRSKTAFGYKWKYK